MVSHIALMQALAKFGRDEDGALRLIVTAAGGSPNASFTITRVDGVPNSDLIAPAGVMLRASNLAGFNVTEPAGNTNEYDPTQHQISYFWDFGDSAYTPRFTPNIPTAWRNTNIAYGKSVAHVYAAPGNYTVTCFAFDDVGNWGTATYTFQSGGNAGPILDPATVFANALTICYSPANNFTGAPSGSSNQTTLLGVRNAANSAGARCRILARRDEVYDFAAGFSVNGAPALGKQGGNTIHYGTYGSGTNAPLMRTKSDGPLRMQDVFGGQCVISGWDFEGGWDAPTESGTFGGIFAELGQYAENMVFHRCRVSGHGQIQLFDDPSQNATVANGCVIWNDCQITNWKDYGILGAPARMAIVGCDIFQHVDALTGVNQGTGGQTPTRLGNTHGPWRAGAMTHCYVACSSFFSRCGWSSPGGGIAPTVSQATMRFTVNPVTVRVHEMHERCSHESMGVTHTMESVGTPPSTIYARNKVYDKCLFVATAYAEVEQGNGGPMWQSTGVGLTMRNCYFWRPNVARQVTLNVLRSVVRINVDAASQAALAAVPNRFYNNTIWIPGPTSNIGTTAPIFVEANNATVQQANNVLFAPDLTTPIGTANAPLGSSPISGFAARFKGGRWAPPPIGVDNTIPIQSVREGGAGPVANNEWVSVPYPVYTGQNGYTLTVTQTMCNSSPSKKHIVSVSGGPRGMSDSTIWADGDGRVLFDFTSTAIRIQNRSGTTWVTPWTLWVKLDLPNQLMAGFVGASPADVPLPVPGTGSAARNGYTTGLRAREDFFGNVRAGERNTTGTIQGGTADLGAFEIA